MSKFDSDREEERKSGEPQPHKHWEENAAFARKVLELPEAKSIIEDNSATVVWDGTNKIDGKFEVLTCINIYWKRDNKNFGYPMSLHQEKANFRKQISAFFRLKDNYY